MTTQTTHSAPFTFEQLMESLRKTEQIVQETSLQMKETDRKLQETDRIVKETALQMRETDQKMKETDRQMKETDRQMKETDRQIKENDRKMNKKLAELGDRIGELVAAMVEGGIVKKFCTLGYTFSGCARRYEFENKLLGISGEIDLFLENGNDALAVEIKTNLSINDVKMHIKRMEKFRQYADARNDKRQFVAAVGGGVVRKEVQEYAMKQGIYVVIPTGDSVEIAALPKGFKAKIW
jgi:hypothetical protein